MSALTRLGLFAAGLVAIFSAAVGIGALFEAAATEEEGESSHAESSHAEGRPEDDSRARPGLSDGGLSIQSRSHSLNRGETGELSFRIVGPSGRAVTDFDELHERRMHLIVVRRDGTGFRHLHPEIDRTGDWSAGVRFEQAGAHRAFADFSTGGEQHTLAVDLHVSGVESATRPFPAPTSTGSVDGYEVELGSTALEAGHRTSLSFSVTRDGAAVDDLSPYLGAMGHLVALREGDLAFLHVHPEEAEEGHGHAGSASGHGSPAAGEIGFAATFPTAGRYRLYLQFRHQGAVRTVEFTVEVER